MKDEHYIAILEEISNLTEEIIKLKKYIDFSINIKYKKSFPKEGESPFFSINKLGIQSSGYTKPDIPLNKEELNSAKNRMMEYYKKSQEKMTRKRQIEIEKEFKIKPKKSRPKTQERDASTSEESATP